MLANAPTWQIIFKDGYKESSFKFIFCTCSRSHAYTGAGKIELKHIHLNSWILEMNIAPFYTFTE